MLVIMRRITRIVYPKQIRLMSNGNGAGKGGAGGAGKVGGGAAPEAEGNVDKMKSVREDEFFHKQRTEQLRKLKNKKESTKPSEKSKK